METLHYTVPQMSCAHCEAAITEEIAGVAGVESVTVDLDSKLVEVRGAGVEDAAIRAAINEAGYDVA